MNATHAHRDYNTVEIPRTKERFVFRDSPATDDVLAFEFIVGPGGAFPLRHYHDQQSETFHCVSGELTVHLDAGDRVLCQGDEIELSPGTMHAFSNRGDVDAVCEVAYRPAGLNAPWLRIYSALEQHLGREPGLLDIAPFIGRVGIYIEGPPRWGQIALFAVLGPIATLLGRKRRALAAAEAVYGRPFTWPP